MSEAATGRATETTVALILFNRPERIAEVIAAVRPSRPRRIVAIADGPRRDRPDDRERCAKARAALDAIDWPCEVVRDFASENLGCSARIESGLDGIFARVDRAIVLEDDTLPTPSFLPWIESMLETWASDPAFAFATGFNALGTWGGSAASHFCARKGRTLGWATTSAAWRRMRSIDLAAQVNASGRLARTADLDPIAALQCEVMIEEVARGDSTNWDRLLRARAVAAGMFTVISSVNLVANTGVGLDATHTTDLDEFTNFLPVGSAGPASGRGSAAIDSEYDRRAVLIELLGLSLRPEVAARLARASRENPALPIDGLTRLHLQPFLHPELSIDALEHLRRGGVASPRLERVLAVLRGVAAERS